MAVARRVAKPALYVFAVLLALGFAGAGTWQWQRAAGKQSSLDRQQQLLAAREPVPLTAADAGAGLDWGRGRGHFPPLPALLLDNQQRGGRAGLRLYRVFVPAAGGRALLVDLGWLPWPDGREPPALPALPDKVIELAGLLAPPPSPGLPLGASLQVLGDDAWLLMRIVPGEIADALGLQDGLASRVLRLDPAIPIGHARDLELFDNTLPPQRHRGYAVQWFGLAAATIVVTVVLAVRGRA